MQNILITNYRQSEHWMVDCIFESAGSWNAFLCKKHNLLFNSKFNHQSRYLLNLNSI